MIWYFPVLFDWKTAICRNSNCLKHIMDYIYQILIGIVKNDQKEVAYM